MEMRPEGELRERRWSVLSERGCEAAKLMYEEAVRLIKRLEGEKVHGLCIITNEAASRAMHQEEAYRASTQTVKAKRR
jgi:hypothetical protein